MQGPGFINPTIEPNGYLQVELLDVGGFSLGFIQLANVIGPAGRSITNAKITTAGELEFQYSDNTNENLGQVTGNNGPSRPPILQLSTAEFAANTYPAGFTQGWCTVDGTNGTRYYYLYDDEATLWPAINNTTNQTGKIYVDDPIGFEPHQWVKDVTLAQTGVGAQLLQLATTTDALGNSTKAFSAKALNSNSPNLGISSTSTEIAFVPNQYIAGKAFINISAVPANTDIDLFWYLTALAGNSRPSSLEFRWQGPADGLNGNNSWVTNSQAVLQLVMKTTIPVAPGMAEQVLCEPFELGPIGPTAHALIDLTQALRTFVHPTGGSQTVRKTYTVFNGGTASQSYLCLRIVQPSTVPGTQIICLVRGVF